MKNAFTFLATLFVLSLFVAFPSQAQKSGDGDLTPIELLGKKLFFDKIADPDNMSCADCHGPKVGFTGPVPAINKRGAVYPGAVKERFGNRKPPSAAYATFSPVFYYDETEGLFIGGNFWDGRATGELLGNPAADQALGPFLNPVEQNNPDKEAVLVQIEKSNYADLWEEVWGEPISVATTEDIAKNYDRVGLSIEAYEASSEVNAFTSKFDYYLLGEVELTEEEEWGMELFMAEEPGEQGGAGKCALCHIIKLDLPPESSLFTDFTFDNLGTPKNPENPFYDMDEVYLPNGDPINPLGDEWIDYGLGAFLASQTDPFYSDNADENMGKHKVPTLRNVDKRPGKGFTKAFMHNGVFKSLKEVVNFYNTRDVEDWPPPEVPENVNTDELGDLGLTDEEEDAIVAFLKTLGDGYKLKKSSPLSIGDDEVIVDLEVGPNPFENTTNISFLLAEPNYVELFIYNLNGLKIKTLASINMNRGVHSFSLELGDLPKGIYIIAVNAGNQLKTKKVTLVR